LPCPVCHQLHREQAVTGRFFQSLPTQTDSTVALIYKIENFLDMSRLGNTSKQWSFSTNYNEKG
jgi:hypothetical protein